jgi:adenylate cyclase
MRPRTRLRDLLAVLLAIVVVTIAVLVPGSRIGLSGWSSDSLFWLRNFAFGPRRPASDSHVVIVLIDQTTYDTYNMPKDFWSPYYGAVIAALDQAGARAIGFDVILPYSISRQIPGYDKVLWSALRQAGSAGKLVLAQGQSGDETAEPAPEQRMLVGAGNIRSVTLQEDADGVVRRQPLTFRTATQPPRQEPGFAAELARRAGWTPHEGTLLLDFDGGHPFETYSLADLAACAKDNHTDFFSQHFKNRVVLIGTGLQFEDRLLTSSRLINPPEALTGARCELPAPPPARYARDTMPGVFVHATAIDNLLRNEGLRSLPLPGRIVLMLAVAGLGAILGLRAGFLKGGIAQIGVLTGLTVAATVLFQHEIETPLLEALLAVILSYFLLLGYRLVITEHGRRHIRQMFGYYLAPSVVERLEALGELPERGGERRQMTFFFSDIASFTTLTEAADPMLLAPTLNAYFDGVCAAIEAQGGIVIEFLGDGVQAMFGAPAEQPDHAARAVAAARAVQIFSEEFRHQGVAKEMKFGHTRLGVHTGDALVGNIGASQRLKYAALGDVVNATSRLEGLNKYFGTRICISEETAQASGDPDVRRIGDFLVKGKSRPVRVYELLAQGTGMQDWVVRYRTAYELLAQGDIGAAVLFERLAVERPNDQIISFYLQRARSGELDTTIQMTDK